jgi:hypothetical protein
MRIGLTFDEYVDLKVRPHSVADHVSHEAAEEESGQLFPMRTAAAATHLRSRGYDVRPSMLDLLVEDGVVKLAKKDVWSEQDIERAAEHFEDCDVFTPYAAMCQALGCRYAGFLRPLREAADEAARKYGRHVPNDDQYFVMHRVPPRGKFDADGNMVGTTSSVISFTLCDDIRERLERGEEV